MKKRVLALSAMMLCIVMLFSSCALFTPTIKFKNFIQKDAAPETDPTLTKVDALSIKGGVQTSDYTYSSSDDLVVLIDEDPATGLRTTTVYNLTTNQVLCTKEDSESKSGSNTVKVTYSVKLINLYAEDEAITLVCITKKAVTGLVDSDAKYDVTVLSENGTTVVELADVNASSVIDSMWYFADLVRIDNKVYRFDANGNVKDSFDWSDLRDAPSYLTKAGDYYVEISERSIFVFDKTLKLVTTYTAPQYDMLGSSLGITFNASVLANGNVLVQYMSIQDTMAKKYTFILNGQKCNIYSMLVDAKTGKVKELNLDYVIEEVLFGEECEYCGISEKIENVAVAYAIENQRVDMNEDSMKVLSLTNKGKVAGVLESPISGAGFGEGIDLYSKNRWEIYTPDGRSYLVNEKGEVLGEVSNVDYYNDAGLIVNKKVYDYNLNLKIDLAKENATELYVMNNGVAFKTEKNEIKIYINGEVKTLVSESEAKDGKRIFKKLSKGAYMITDTTGTTTKYEIYNENGTLLSTITDKISSVNVVKTAANGALLLSAYQSDSSKTVYYRVG